MSGISPAELRFRVFEERFNNEIGGMSRESRFTAGEPGPAIDSAGGFPQYQFFTGDLLNSFGVILYGKKPKFTDQGGRFSIANS